MAADIIRRELQTAAGAEDSSIWKQRRGAALPPADRIRYQTNFGRRPAPSDGERYRVLDLTKPRWKNQPVECLNTLTILCFSSGNRGLSLLSQFPGTHHAHGFEPISGAVRWFSSVFLIMKR